MSPKERIAKLEGLLSRVKERAEAPRPNGAVAIAAAAPRPAQPGSVEPATAATKATPAVFSISQPLHGNVTAASPAGAVTSAAPTEVALTSAEEAVPWSQPSPTDVETVETVSDDYESEIEVSSEVVEVEIDVDEPVMMMPAESGAQPVALHAAVLTSKADELEEVVDDDGGGDIVVDYSAPPPAAEVSALPGNEVEEPAPTSSPRPIVSAAAENYEEESAPRHTPPPESGKQVTAPSVKPVTRESSIPPESEGHTLVGGWRQPGIAPQRAPSDAPRTPAVRVPPPPRPPSSDTTPVQLPGLTADVTKPDLPASANVVTLQAAAPVFAPSTFGELLDASLAL